MAKDDAQIPEPIRIENDQVGALFERRWLQECQTSLLLANENRVLHARNAHLTDEFERLTARVEELVATQAKDADGRARKKD